jgi:hypothetical protein
LRWSADERDALVTARRELAGAAVPLTPRRLFIALQRIVPLAGGYIATACDGVAGDLVVPLGPMPEGVLDGLRVLAGIAPAYARVPSVMALHDQNLGSADGGQRLSQLLACHGLGARFGLALSLDAGEELGAGHLEVFARAAGPGASLRRWRMLEAVLADVVSAIERMRVPLLPRATMTAALPSRFTFCGSTHVATGISRTWT